MHGLKRIKYTLFSYIYSNIKFLSDDINNNNTEKTQNYKEQK